MSDDPYAPVLPRAVREQVERANQLAREAGIANVPPIAEPAPSEDGAVTPDVTPGSQTPPELQQATPAPDGPLPEQTGPDGARQGTLDLPTASPAPSGEANWEARYNTLQGKYNSEVPNLRGELAALRETVNALRQQAQYAPPPRAELPAPAAPPQRPSYEIPATDVENYGQDLITASQRWAEAKYAPTLADYERRLAAVEGNTRQLGQLSMTGRVEAALDGAIPNWRDLNQNDPIWDDWLNQVDVFSGRPRKQLITEAYQAGDSARTIAFFQSYLREQTAVSPPISPGIRQSQTGNGAMPVGPTTPTPLEMLAVPGRGPVSNPSPYSAPGAQNGSRRNWSGADISAFYDQVRRGLWRGREAEVFAIEQDISRSGLEGRYNA